MTLSETAGSDADTIAAPATDSALPGGGHPATAYPPVPRMAGVTDGDYRTGRCECGRRSHAPTGRAASSTTRPPVPGRSADTATTRPPARVCGVCVSRPRRQTTIPSLHGPGHPEPVAGQSPPRVHTPTPTIVRAGACCGDTCSATGGQPSKRSRPPLELGGRILTVSATSVDLEVVMPSGYPYSKSVRPDLFDRVYGAPRRGRRRRIPTALDDRHGEWRVRLHRVRELMPTRG